MDRVFSVRGLDRMGSLEEIEARNPRAAAGAWARRNLEPGEESRVEIISHQTGDVWIASVAIRPYDHVRQLQRADSGERACRECGRTDAFAFLDELFEPLRWVEPDLCSACATPEARR
ncbi:MAG: hypothetical protein OXJ37_11000 [Bryobacterales bacterium]|nr:hypothetical protein [Bryobacterales bacterium]